MKNDNLEKCQKALSEIVKDLEGGSSIELVPILTLRSSEYKALRFLVSLGLSTFILIIVSLFLPWHLDKIWIGACIQILLFFLLNVFSFNLLDLIPRKFFENAFAHIVDLQATKDFYQLDISRTKSRRGLLLYVSLFERRIQLIPDRALTRDGLQFWHEQTSELLAFMKANQEPEEGLVVGLKQIIQTWKLKYPKLVGDINELDDDVIINKKN